MEAGEMRWNPVTGEWVIYASGRRSRPDEMGICPRRKERSPSHEKTCPFCPGNERMLPEILLELEGKDGNWQVRVVPNQYPAIRSSGSGPKKSLGIYRVMESSGNHEVIIESPFHHRPVGRMGVKEAGVLIEAYHRRYKELANRRKNKTVIVFRNHGAAAGTSLSHPHSQIMALEIVPRSIRTRQRAFTSYFKNKGRCLICDMMKFELSDKRRLLFKNERFVCFIPFAAEVSFETWIVPRKHQVDFSEISELEKGDFAKSLVSVLSGLQMHLNDPDYNFVIQTNTRARKENRALHWYLQIKPRMSTPAGFEMGSGMHINPTFPESDAQILLGRKIKIR